MGGGGQWSGGAGQGHPKHHAADDGLHQGRDSMLYVQGVSKKGGNKETRP